MEADKDGVFEARVCDSRVLQRWQARALFMMDRITLVRTVLNSMLVYLLFNTIMSKTYLAKLEYHF